MSRVVPTSLFAVATLAISASASAGEINCPAGASFVELPAPATADAATLGQPSRVLRCVDDASGLPNGPEFWFANNGHFYQRGRWEQGKRSGLWERWYPAGHVLSHFTFQVGNQISGRCLDEKRFDLTCLPQHGPVDWRDPNSPPPAVPAAAPAPGAVPAVAPPPVAPGMAPAPAPGAPPVAPPPPAPPMP